MEEVSQDASLKRRRRRRRRRRIFVFNDTIQGPRAPAVKPGRVLVQKKIFFFYPGRLLLSLGAS